MDESSLCIFFFFNNCNGNNKSNNKGHCFSFSFSFSLFFAETNAKIIGEFCLDEDTTKFSSGKQISITG